jgi:hypothetical protein
MPLTDSRQGVGTLTIEAHDFSYQAAAVRLTPDVSSEDGTPTLAVPEPAPDTSVTWALNIDSIQDFEEPLGLVNYLMDNALSEAPFVWTPITSAGVVYNGTIQIVPMEIGGDVGVQVVTSVELPLVGQPTRVDGVLGTSRTAPKREVKG